MQDATWRAWPFLNWLLPLWVCFHGLLGSGGWESLLLTLASPLIVPAGGLLGSLPRFLLRRAGHRRTPAPMLWLLIVHWWSWFLVGFTMRGSGDSGSIDSLFARLVPAPMSSLFEIGVFLVTVLLGVLSWVALLVLALALRPQAPAQQERSRWLLVGRIAAVGVPALFVVAVLIGVQATLSQRDAAGDTVAVAEARPIAEQAALADERYERTQAQLGEVRALIAPTDWRIDVGGIGVERAPGGGCRFSGVDCYAFHPRFAHETAGAAVTPAELAAELEAAGWRVTRQHGRQVTAENDAGERLEVSWHRESALGIELTSPFWWGDGSAAVRALERDYDPSIWERTYAADEWPQLR